MYDNLLKIGKITSTYALKGEVKFLLDKDLNLIQNINGIKVFLENSHNSIEVYEVSKSYFINKKQILKLEGIENIEQAQKLINNFVYVNKENDFFEINISYINFETFHKNLKYGVVIDEMFNGAQNLIKVRNNDNKEFWVPCVEVFVEKIDEQSKIIYLKEVEGLI